MVTAGTTSKGADSTSDRKRGKSTKKHSNAGPAMITEEEQELAR